MKIISILSPPSKSIYLELDNLFSSRYNIVYLNKVIRENMYEKNDLWLSIMNDLQLGNNIKTRDFSNIIYNYASSEDKDCILLTGFLRNSEQIDNLRNFFNEKKLDFELIGVFNKSKDNISLKKLHKDYDSMIEISKITDLLNKI